jgi:hypothetical protein
LVFKIQTIEKLFSYLLEYSYLLLLPTYFLSKSRKQASIILIGIYGLVFFSLLHFHDDIPRSLRKPFQYVYTFLEYSTFAFIIWYYVRNKTVRKVIVISSILFVVFQLLHFLLTKRQKLDSVVIGVETILIFLFIFLYLRQFFKYNVTENIYEYPSFWLVVGILIYLGFGFFFNILVNYIPQQQFDNYWHFTYIPEIIKNILFGVVLLGYPSPRTEKSFSKGKRVDIPNLDII